MSACAVEIVFVDVGGVENWFGCEEIEAADGSSLFFCRDYDPGWAPLGQDFAQSCQEAHLDLGLGISRTC